MEESGWPQLATTPEAERIVPLPAAPTPDIEKRPGWSPPPIPPIPTDQEEEAWRRRSSKRQSYTSQMAFRASQSSLHTTAAADVEKAPRPFSQVSMTSTVEVRGGR